MKKVLIITDIDFWQQGAGHRARVAALVEYLADKVDLTIFYTNFLTYRIALYTQFFNTVKFIAPEPGQRLSDSAYGRKLRKHLAANKVDAIIIEGIHNSHFLEYLPGEVQLFLDTHDLINERASSFKAYNYDGYTFELSKADERHIMSFYDYVMLICKPDLETFIQMDTGAKGLLVSHPAVVTQKEVRKQVENIVANKDAIEYFIHNCWQHIYTRNRVNLLIYGQICGIIDTGGFEGIKTMGFVQNLSEAYRNADIIINPVRFGAGIKIKNIEALSNGIPLVTTTHGGRGLEEAVNSSLLIADSPIEIIDKINFLIENFDIRKQMSENAVRFVNENFNADLCIAPLLQILNDKGNLPLCGSY